MFIGIVGWASEGMPGGPFRGCSRKQEETLEAVTKWFAASLSRKQLRFPRERKKFWGFLEKRIIFLALCEISLRAICIWKFIIGILAPHGENSKESNALFVPGNQNNVNKGQRIG